jgi:hypothetical protein
VQAQVDNAGILADPTAKHIVAAAIGVRYVPSRVGRNDIDGAPFPSIE